MGTIKYTTVNLTKSYPQILKFFIQSYFDSGAKMLKGLKGIEEPFDFLNTLLKPCLI